MDYVLIEMWRRQRRARRDRRHLERRALRDQSNPFEVPDTEFVSLFRANKAMVIHLTEELQNDLKPIHTGGVPVHIKILIGLRFIADGSYQRGIGQNLGLCVAQQTVSNILKDFRNAVIRILLPKWIVFPGTEAQRKEISDGFLAKHGVDNVIGAIDCTHVAIVSPNKPQSAQYKNRKGIYSLNCQLIVDVNCRIMSVVARYPGRVHDQFIFNNSNIKTEMKEVYENGANYFLIGDSGYALEPWLMTPVLHAAEGSAEEAYTQWHCKARNCVERTNGYIKNTFRCLRHDRVLHYAPEVASQIIYTACTLYNILLYFRVPQEDFEEERENAAVQAARPSSRDSLYRVALARRQNLISTYFPRN